MRRVFFATVCSTTLLSAAAELAVRLRLRTRGAHPSVFAAPSADHAWKSALMRQRTKIHKYSRLPARARCYPSCFGPLTARARSRRRSVVKGLPVPSSCQFRTGFHCFHCIPASAAARKAPSRSVSHEFGDFLVSRVLRTLASFRFLKELLRSVTIEGMPRSSESE